MSIFVGSLFLPCKNNQLKDPAGIAVVLFAIVEWYFLTQVISSGAMANIGGNFYLTISMRTFLDFVLKLVTNLYKLIKLNYIILKNI